MRVPQAGLRFPVHCDHIGPAFDRRDDHGGTVRVPGGEPQRVAADHGGAGSPGQRGRGREAVDERGEPGDDRRIGERARHLARRRDQPAPPRPVTARKPNGSRCSAAVLAGSQVASAYAVTSVVVPGYAADPDADLGRVDARLGSRQQYAGPRGEDRPVPCGRAERRVRVQPFQHGARVARRHEDLLAAGPPGPGALMTAQQRRQRRHVRRLGPRREAELRQQMPGQRLRLRPRAIGPG